VLLFSTRECCYFRCVFTNQALQQRVLTLSTSVRTLRRQSSSLVSPVPTIVDGSSLDSSTLRATLSYA
jgi:hypothetical protein